MCTSDICMYMYNSPKGKTNPSSVSNKLADLETSEVASIRDSPTEVTYAEVGKPTSEDTDEALLHGYALVDLDKVRA